MSQFDGVFSRRQLAILVGAVLLGSFTAGAGVRDIADDSIRKRKLCNIMNGVTGANEGLTSTIAQVLTGDSVQRSISEKVLKEKGVDTTSPIVQAQIKAAGYTLTP